MGAVTVNDYILQAIKITSVLFIPINRRVLYVVINASVQFNSITSAEQNVVNIGLADPEIKQILAL